MIELLNEILSTISRNRLRTALTGFAVAWGIFMLVLLLGAGNGLINAQMVNMNRFMSTSLMAGGGVTSKPYDGLKEGRQIEIDNADIADVSHKLSDRITDSGAIISQSAQTVSLGDEYYTAEVEGVAPSYADIEHIEMAEGRFIDKIDQQERRKIVAIDSENARLLGHGNASSVMGQYVKINGIAFRIVGIYKADLSNSQSSVYMPFTTFQTIYSRGDKVDEMLLSFRGIDSEASSSQFESDIRTIVNANHRAAKDDTESLWIWNRFTGSMQMNRGVMIIESALWIIGLLTLLSGIVGVSNIMLITVKERTREFGIRKAIGATPWAIMRLIIAESVSVTIFFGYIGMLLGIAANEWMKASSANNVVKTDFFEMQTFVDPTVGLGTCLGVLAVLVVAGTLAGLIPARKAAMIKPIEALRAE